MAPSNLPNFAISLFTIALMASTGVACSDPCGRAIKEFNSTRMASVVHERALVEFLGEDTLVYPGGIVEDLAVFCESRRDEPESIAELRRARRLSSRALSNAVCQDARGIMSLANDARTAAAQIQHSCDASVVAAAAE